MCDENNTVDDAPYALNDVCGHELRCFSYGEASPTLRIRCVDALSPADSLLLSQEGEASTDLTGHCIWTAARIAAALIQRRRLRLSPSTTIVELGAGTGFWGLSAAMAFAIEEPWKDMRVVLTDGTDSAVKLLRENVEENRFECTSGSVKIDVAKLVWGKAEDIAAIRERVLTGVDYCFATDCIYDMSVLPALFSTAYCLLCGESETVVVSDREKMRETQSVIGDVGKKCFVVCNVMNRMMESDLAALDRKVIQAAADAGFSEYCLVDEAVEILGKEEAGMLDDALIRAIDGMHLPLFCFWVQPMRPT